MTRSILPNEILTLVIGFCTDKREFLFVCKYTYKLVSQQVYRRVIFPDSVNKSEILDFCRRHGQQLETIKLPQGHRYPDFFFSTLLQLCPRLTFLQATAIPSQLTHLLPMRPAACFMLTHLPLAPTLVNDDTLLDCSHHSLCCLSCCSSVFVFPSQYSPASATLTHIAEYFHHPGALRNAILPTFGPDLLSLTLNPYDVLTAPVARLIVSKCPRLRYLVVPNVKAEGLWMLLRWCQTLVAIIVGEHRSSLTQNRFDSNDDSLTLGIDTVANVQRQLADEENERAVSTIEHHKRVWCIHLHPYDRKSWHIGIIPRK